MRIWVGTMSNHNMNGKTKSLIREKKGNKCERCGCQNGAKNDPGSRLQLHHKIPRCYGGKNTADNLELLCKRCHDQSHIEYAKKQIVKMKKTYEKLINTGQYSVGG